MSNERTHRHLGYWIVLLATVALTVAVWDRLAALIPVRESRMRFIAEVRDRQSRIAASFNGPKLCLVGASGTRFGVHAATIERETGVHTVNFGLTGELNLGYMLERSKRDLRRGDTVLLVPEYLLLNGPRPVTLGALRYFQAYDVDYLRTMPILERVAIPLRLTWRELADGLGARLRRKSISQEEPGGRVGDRGDVEYGEKPSADQLASILKPDPLDEGGPNELELADLRKYAGWCRDNGVQLLVSYPAYSRLWDLQTPGGRKFIAEVAAAYRNLGVPVLGKPEDFFYDSSWFYNSRSHLKPDMAEFSTLQRVKLLWPYLKR